MLQDEMSQMVDQHFLNTNSGILLLNFDKPLQHHMDYCPYYTAAVLRHNRVPNT